MSGKIFLRDMLLAIIFRKNMSLRKTRGSLVKDLNIKIKIPQRTNFVS